MRTVQIRSHRVVIGRCFRNEVTVLIDGVDVTKNLTGCDVKIRPGAKSPEVVLSFIPEVLEVEVEDGEGKPETYVEPEES